MEAGRHAPYRDSIHLIWTVPYSFDAAMHHSKSDASSQLYFSVYLVPLWAVKHAWLCVCLADPADPAHASLDVPPQAVAAAGQLVAVGTSTGMVVVVQLPLPQQPGAPAAPAAAPTVWHLGEPRGEGEAVTALGFSVMASPGDSLWLAVGHASGAVAIWDLQKRGPRQVASIGACGRPAVFSAAECTEVTQVQVLAGSCSTILALHGRAVKFASQPKSC